MLVLLVLATGVAGDWVEIAQQPSRGAPSAFGYDGTMNTNTIYANYSLAERPGRRTGMPRNPNFGSVKRVQLLTKERDLYAVALSSKSTIVKEKQGETSRYGSSSGVRAPGLEIKTNIDINDPKRNYEDDVRRLYSENVNESNLRLRNPARHFQLGSETSSQKPNLFKQSTHTTEKYKFSEIIDSNMDHHINTNVKRLDIHPTRRGVATGSGEALVEVNKYLKKNERNVGNNHSGIILNYKPKTNPKNNISPKDRTQPRDPFFSDTDVKFVSNNCSDSHAEEQIKISNDTTFFQTHKSQETVNTKSANSSGQNSSGVQQKEVSASDNRGTNTVELIWRLMKVVADTISRNTRRSSRSKIRYLEELRNNIMANIEYRIEQAWPDDEVMGAEARTARRAREARGHVEFPSSESALMTISFLTFAVFLIKLVLQVIHTYKNKSMVVAPALVAAVGRAATAALRDRVPL